MQIHESSINYKKLIQDLADMYPFDVSEVIVTELIANALDAKATKIQIDYHNDKKILVIEDNGLGMTKKQFDEYHDFAAGLKHRGVGIGFAGLGAKISFNIASCVITETKNSSHIAGSKWYLESNKKLVWQEIIPTKIKNNGTRVEVQFNKECSIAYKDSNDILKLIRRHYLPLLDMSFLGIYEKLGHYSREFRFVINGEMVNPFNLVDKFQLEKESQSSLKYGKKVVGGWIVGLSKDEYPIEQGMWGVLLCTYGKVVKAESFNQFPGNLGPRILGVAEIPELIDFLTAQKTEFTKKGQFKKFENLVHPVRVAFIDWLKDALGVQQEQVLNEDESANLEKEIKKIVNDIPEISDLFGSWMRRNVLLESPDGSIPTELEEGVGITLPDGSGNVGQTAIIPDKGDSIGQNFNEKDNGEIPAQPISRSTKRGPKISIIAAEQRNKELAWVEGYNVIINSSHPLLKRVEKSNKSKTVAYMFAFACAIQKHIKSDKSEERVFNIIDEMMAAWGSKWK